MYVKLAIKMDIISTANSFFFFITCANVPSQNEADDYKYCFIAVGVPFYLQVDKLEVVNKKWVRIKLVPGTQMDGSVRFRMFI